MQLFHATFQSFSSQLNSSNSLGNILLIQQSDYVTSLSLDKILIIQSSLLKRDIHLPYSFLIKLNDLSLVLALMKLSFLVPINWIFLDDVQFYINRLLCLINRQSNGIKFAFYLFILYFKLPSLTLFNLLTNSSFFSSRAKLFFLYTMYV